MTRWKMERVVVGGGVGVGVGRALLFTNRGMEWTTWADDEFQTFIKYRVAPFGSLFEPLVLPDTEFQPETKQA